MPSPTTKSTISNIETVHSLYAAFGRKDVPAILASLRDDVEWQHAAGDPGVPWFAPRRGRAEVAKFFEGFAALEHRRFEPVSFLEGPDQVAVVIRAEIAVRATGKVINDLVLHLFTFDGEGRIASLRYFVDTRQHVAAAS